MTNWRWAGFDLPFPRGILWSDKKSNPMNVLSNLFKVVNRRILTDETGLVLLISMMIVVYKMNKM